MAEIFLICLGLTLLLEFGFALLWGVKGKDFLVILLMNCVTNPLVVLWHYTHLMDSLWVNTLFPEAAAIGAEMTVLRYFCKNTPAPVLLGFFINLFSYCMGSVILFFVQGG